MASKKQVKAKVPKGQSKLKPDNNDPEKNPLLHIENKHDFQIETGNLLEDPSGLIWENYENFDLSKDKDHFDISMLNRDSSIVVILRYYEYICTAIFKFNYILPLLESGLIAKDVFEMIKHSLKTRLLVNVPSFDNVFEPEIQYIGKVKYL